MKVEEIQKEISGNGEKFVEFASTLAEHGGKIERSLLLNSTTTNRVDMLETQSRDNERKISTVAAATSAQFVEVETQLRGENAVKNTQLSMMYANLQAAFSRVDIELPDIEYWSENIPAQATTSVGQVNGRH